MPATAHGASRSTETPPVTSASKPAASGAQTPQRAYAHLKGKDPRRLRAVLGFDGFVDEIVEAVDAREDFDRYSRIETIERFAQRIAGAAGLSTNIELVPVQMKLGGNGPIMANALTALGLEVRYAGALGRPDMHPVFAELAERCAEVCSVANPGRTDALEFRDGKIMVGKLAPLGDVNWENVRRLVGAERLGAWLREAHLAAFVNWTMLPHMDTIWDGICDEILPGLPVADPKPWAFFDLADPEKRRSEDIRAALERLSRFASHFRTCLGVNFKEALELVRALEIDLGRPPGEAPSEVPLEALVRRLFDALKVDCLVVHPVDRAAAVTAAGYVEEAGPYTPDPKLTTGAGDNFNAGFTLGLALGLPLDEALAAGTAASGFYVRNARSASFDELLDFLRAGW